MEAQIIHLTGTPEEIVEAMKLLPAGASFAASNGVGFTHESDEIDDWMDEWRVPSRLRRNFRHLIQAAQAWDGVELKITGGREGLTETAGRIRFVYDDQRKGFAFIHHKGNLVFHTNHDDLAKYPHAKPRSGKAAKGVFNTTINVRKAEVLDEALSLLEKAYESAKSASE